MFPSILFQKLMRYKLESKRKRMSIWTLEWEVHIFFCDAKINTFQHFNISLFFLLPLLWSSSKQSFTWFYKILKIPTRDYNSYIHISITMFSYNPYLKTWFLVPVPQLVMCPSSRHSTSQGFSFPFC